MLGSNDLHVFHVAGPTPNMDSDNPRSSGGNQSFNLFCVNVMRFKVNIAKYRGYSWNRRACAAAINVKEGTITSPLNPKALKAISSATVPLHMGMQCLTPNKSAILFSN